MYMCPLLNSQHAHIRNDKPHAGWDLPQRVAKYNQTQLGRITEHAEHTLYLQNKQHDCTEHAEHTLFESPAEQATYLIGVRHDLISFRIVERMTDTDRLLQGLILTCITICPTESASSGVTILMALFIPRSLTDDCSEERVRLATKCLLK